MGSNMAFLRAEEAREISSAVCQSRNEADLIAARAILKIEIGDMVTKGRFTAQVTIFNPSIVNALLEELKELGYASKIYPADNIPHLILFVDWGK